MIPKIITTSDGSNTLYLPDMDEQYHSVHGAIQESAYVYLEKGYSFHSSSHPVVFEVGFGTGLNCLLTAVSAEKTKRPTTCFALEKFPLEKNITDRLNHGEIISGGARELQKKIHECPWNVETDISSYFTLCKIKGDLITYDLKQVPEFDVVYFDAFGPDKQPEMWSHEIFSRIYSKTRVNGIFVTYSAKGRVRRELAACGFKMEKLPGPPGKLEMLRGIKTESTS